MAFRFFIPLPGPFMWIRDKQPKTAERIETDRKVGGVGVLVLLVMLVLGVIWRYTGWVGISTLGALLVLGVAVAVLQRMGADPAVAGKVLAAGVGALLAAGLAVAVWTFIGWIGTLILAGLGAFVGFGAVLDRKQKREAAAESPESAGAGH